MIITGHWCCVLLIFSIHSVFGIDSVRKNCSTWCRSGDSALYEQTKSISLPKDMITGTDQFGRNPFFYVSVHLKEESNCIQDEGSECTVIENLSSDTNITHLLKHSSESGFGEQGETVYDENVRRSRELLADQVTVKFLKPAADWSKPREPTDLESIVGENLKQWLNVDNIRLTLNKFVMYEPGGKFLPHRDVHRGNGHLARLLIGVPHRETTPLPSVFSSQNLDKNGGDFELTLTNGETFVWKYSNFDGFSYVAFYPDLEHEVKHIQQGVRAVLVYDVFTDHVSEHSMKARENDLQEARIRNFADHVRSLVESGEVLAMPHNYQYTPDSLTPVNLKGADRILFDAALRTGKAVMLTTVEKQWRGNPYRDFISRPVGDVSVYYRASQSETSTFDSFPITPDMKQSMFGESVILSSGGNFKPDTYYGAKKSGRADAPSVTTYHQSAMVIM